MDIWQYDNTQNKSIERKHLKLQDLINSSKIGDKNHTKELCTHLELYSAFQRVEISFFINPNKTILIKREESMK